MGAQVISWQPHSPFLSPHRSICSMAPMKAMKAKTGKVMTKGAIAQSLAAEFEIKQNGIFTFPGFCRVKTRVKPATKAGKKEIFGEMRMVKAKPARTIVKAFPVAALKASI